MSIIPSFPDSTELSYEHIPQIQSFLIDNRYTISEYSVASLIPFTHKRGYTVSRYVHEHGKDAYLFIGKEKDYRFAMIPAGYPGKIIMNELKTMVYEVNTIARELTDQWMEGMRKDGFLCTIDEDRDNADYLYDRQSLIDLSGQVLHKKMAHVNRFIKDHPERILLPTHIAPEKDMITVLDAWAEGKASVEDYDATRFAIEHREALSLTGYVLYSQDNPIAFTLGELASEDTFIVHIEKALTTYKGVYQYINRAAVSLLPEGIQTINREQDLGIPGLRQAKMTYQPKGFLMKYRLRFDES